MMLLPKPGPQRHALETLWLICVHLWSQKGCPAIGNWLGSILGRIEAIVDCTGANWGPYDPLNHQDLQLYGPKNKRRKISKALRVAAAEQAMEDKKADNTSSMLQAHGSSIRASDLNNIILHETKAAAIHFAQPLHTISCFVV